MEEALFTNILSEYGFIALLLILILYGLYKLAKWFLGRYLDMFEKNSILDREATNKKDIEFLRTVKDVASIVKDGDNRHEEAHDKIGGILTEGHKEISGKLDDIHTEVKKIADKK